MTTEQDEEVLNRGGEAASRFEDSPTETHKTSETPSEADRDSISKKISDSPTITSNTTELRRSTRQRHQSGEWWKASANIALSARLVPLYTSPQPPMITSTFGFRELRVSMILS